MAATFSISRDRRFLENPTPWLVETLLSGDGSFEGGYYAASRLLFVDEPVFSRYWNLEKLLVKSRRCIENDVARNEDKYLVVYASDSKYSTRTLLLMDIARKAGASLVDEDEPPLSYSVLSAKETSDCENVGTRKFSLLVTKYKFRVNVNPECGVSLELIVDEGSILRPDVVNGTLPAQAYSSLWIDCVELRALLLQRYANLKDFPCWEDEARRSVDGEKGEGASSGAFLSALLNGFSDTAPRMTGEDPWPAEDSPREVVWVRSARVQTDPEYTKWVSPLDVRQAAAVLPDMLERERTDERRRRERSPAGEREPAPIVDLVSPEQVQACNSNQIRVEEDEADVTGAPTNGHATYPAIADFVLPVDLRDECMKILFG